MGLFSKKYCDICGEKIGLLGNRKLEDGNLCKDCSRKLSPFFNERRDSTVDEIKDQLKYREENEEKVANFNPTKVIGGHNIICIDEDNKTWLFSRAKNWKENNPDIIDCSQVTGCDLDITEDKREIFMTNDEDEDISYTPPRYEYSYDFHITIFVNSPWFSEIKFKLNDYEIDNTYSPAYVEAKRDAAVIQDTFLQFKDDARAEVISANAVKVAVTCPHCSATTFPGNDGCCEYCGGSVN